jgi:hypothetical protein
VPCAVLAHGQLSRTDTSATLLWAVPLLATIDRQCGDVPPVAGNRPAG